MTGVQVVLGILAGVAAAVVITILRVWLLNRLDGRPDTDILHVPASAEVLEAEQSRTSRGRSG